MSEDIMQLYVDWLHQQPRVIQKDNRTTYYDFGTHIITIHRSHFENEKWCGYISGVGGFQGCKTQEDAYAKVTKMARSKRGAHLIKQVHTPRIDYIRAKKRIS